MNNISNKTIFRFLISIVAFGAVIYLIIALRQPLIWLGISFFFALALEPPVNWLSKRLPKKSRGLAVFIVVAMTFGIVVAMVAMIGPPIMGQFKDLVLNLPTYYREFLDDDNLISSYLRSANLPQTLSISGTKITSFVTNTSGGVVSFFGSIFSSIFALFTVIVFTFFIVLESPRWHTIFWRYQDPKKRVHRKYLYSKMQKTVSGYISGNLLTSLIAGIVTVVFLSIFKNPYAISLGFLVMIFDMIPMFGALIAAVVSVAVVLVYGGVTPAIITAIFFIIYQQVENNILQPYIFSKTVDISPLVAGVAAIFGATLAGLVGALVAIPIAASLQILVKDYLDRHYAVERDGLAE